MSWTNQQSENLARWTGSELAQRKILLRGNGAPTVDAPLLVEYLDVGQVPPVLYVKVAEGPGGWVQDAATVAATQAEVDAGTANDVFVTPETLAVRLAALVSEVQGQLTLSDRYQLTASTATAGADFTVTIPDQGGGQVLTLTIIGYGIGATLVDILGGEVGQIVTVRKGIKDNLKVANNSALRLPSLVTLADLDYLDNITIQRISQTEWIELARTIY